MIAQLAPWVAIAMVAYRAETAASATEDRLRRDVVKIGVLLGGLLVLLFAAGVTLAWFTR